MALMLFQIVIFVCTTVFILTAVPEGMQGQTSPAQGLIQLKDPLDEPEYYCMDVRGVGANLRIDDPLTAHTCKPGAEDEVFTLNHPSSGQLYMGAYDRCLQASRADGGSPLLLVSCSDSVLQIFRYLPDETIRLTKSLSTDLCISVGTDAGEPTGGPSHLRRRLSLEDCSSVEPSLSRWAIPGSQLGR